MDATAIWFFAACWIFLLSIHVTTVAAALIQPLLAYRRAKVKEFPPVTIIMPMCGIVPELSANLDRLFAQDYPNFEVALSFAHADDPAIAVAQDAMLRWPKIKSTLRIGETAEYIDLKVRNEFKCLADARTDFVYIVDSNVSLPPDALRRSMAQMAPDVGVVTAQAVAVRPTNFIGHLELAFMNGFGARYMLAGSALGFDIILGKSMLVRWSEPIRQSVTEQFGKILAEDAAILFGMQELGLRARFSDVTVAHPIGARCWCEFWGRHTRWAMYRRAYHGPKFFLEMATGFLPTLICAGLGAPVLGIDAVTAIGATAAVWFCAEWMLQWQKGWPAGWPAPFASLARELLLPFVWMHALVRREAVWNSVRVPVH